MPTTNENEYAPDVAGRVRAIREATYGSQVREAIASSIEDMNAVVESDTASAKAFANQASESAVSAASSLRTLNTAVKIAESWANGNNSNINPQAINNNAYYYAQQAQSSADSVVGIVAQAEDSANRAASSANECLQHVEAVVAGVAEFNGRSGVVLPSDNDYTADMIRNTESGNSVAADISSLFTSAEEAESNFDDIHNFANVDIDTPVMKCYGVLSGLGYVGLQSMCVAGSYIYTYDYNNNTGIFYRTHITNHGKTQITMTGGHVNKGNGMCYHGGNFYLIGSNTNGDELRSIATISESAISTRAGSNSATLTPSNTVNLANPVNGIDFKEVIDGTVHLWGYRQDGNNQKLIFYDINAVAGSMTLMFEVTFPEAKKFDQDMALIDGYFYIVSDYHGALLKVSTDGSMKKVIRLGEYCDNYMYTGEFEGVAKLNNKILLASTFTDYIESEQTQATDIVVPSTAVDGVQPRRERYIVFTTIDLDTNIKPYTREMRGSLGMQYIVRHVNWGYRNNPAYTWLPDGSWTYASGSTPASGSPYPTAGMAFAAYKNPRHKYVFMIDDPYVNGGNKLLMIVNQKDVQIHLTTNCSGISLFIMGSRITLSSDTTFKIAWLSESTVNYISGPEKCLSIKNYSVGNSRFNSNSGIFNSPFGNQDTSPNGDYVVSRSWGTADSASASTIQTTSITSIPQGKLINFRFQFVVSGAVKQYMGVILTPRSGSARALALDGNMNLALVSFTVSGSGVQFQWYKTLDSYPPPSSGLPQKTAIIFFNYQASMS